MRLRYVALWLLTYVHGVTMLVRTAEGARCGDDDFDDIGSRTARASVVFVGRAQRRLRSSRNSASAGLHWIRFRVEDVLKGQLQAGKAGSNSRQRTIAVGRFRRLPTDESITPTTPLAETEDEPCVWPTVPDLRSRYIVFLKDNHQPQSNSSVNPLPPNAYEASSVPEPFSKRSLKTAKEHACSKCVRPPRVRVRSNDVTLLVGQRLRLNCRASGRPLPLITWYKDGRQLAISSSDRRFKVKSTRKGSRLQISRVRVDDAGRYQCQGRSVVGLSTMATTNVQVRDPESSTKPHARLCIDQTYCLNGGTCYILSSLEQQLCECRGNFQGRRCQEKSIAQTVVGRESPTRLQRLLSRLLRSVS